MSARLSHLRHTMIALAVSLVLPSLTAAQVAEPTAAPPTIVRTELTTAPVVAPVTASVVVPIPTSSGPRVEPSRFARPAAAAPASPMQFRGDRRDVAWMVVGGATLVVGSMVGGDAGTIMMVTGGMIGLMGLFRYMQ